MSSILFISRYYLPEKAAAAVCVNETAKRLADLGHQMTVLTTVPNYPMGVIAPGYRNRLCQEEIIDGVRVVRVWSYISPNRGFLRRILAQLSFGCLAPLLGWKAIGKPDIIIVGSPPLFNVIAGRALARLMRRPYILWVADLWPESAVQLGMLKNRAAIRLSEWLEWSSYGRASLVWVVTEAVRGLLIERGLPSERLFLLTNGVDTYKFRPLPQAPARAELGWGDRFTGLYAGNHGLVYGMTTVLDAAERLRDADVRFVFAGDGTRKEDLVEEASRRGLDNVTFLDAMAHERMPQLLAAADVCLIPLRKMPLLKTTFALKMFEIMACARPFVLGAEGISCSVAVEEAGAALCVEPENAGELTSAILYLRDHPEEAEMLGRNGRKYVEQHFDYDRLTAMLDVRLQVLLGEHTPVELPASLALDSLPETPVPALVEDVETVEIHS